MSSDDDDAAASQRRAVAWSVDVFAAHTAKTTATSTATNTAMSTAMTTAADAMASLPRAVRRRRMTAKERDALLQSRQRARHGHGDDDNSNCTCNEQQQHDDDTNDTHTSEKANDEDDMADELDAYSDALVPRHLTTTRADLAARLQLSLPRLLCVTKQYPRACGVASLTSVYNYLYSRLGESDAYAHRAPVSQEEVMAVLGFAPPYDDDDNSNNNNNNNNNNSNRIAWGTFTGNATLMRWFHALNRHYGLRGHASILYKAHGAGNTRWRYCSSDGDNNNNDSSSSSDRAVLAAVRAALCDPHCALIYHCHNHYMVPVGWQDIPRRRTDMLRAHVAPDDCDTTLFIADVSRGKHNALYARAWRDVVRDIECVPPSFVDIRRLHLGVQTRTRRADGGDARGSNHTSVTDVVASPASPSSCGDNDTDAPTKTTHGAPDATTPPSPRDETTTTTTTTPPPVLAQPRTRAGFVACNSSSNNTRSRSSGAAAAAASVSLRSLRRNLHCLICFRNDRVEEHMSRYEHTTDDEDNENDKSSSSNDEYERNNVDNNDNNTAASVHDV